MFNKDLNLNTVNFIKNEYLKDDIPWYLGYSGGKDSSAVLKLTFNAMLQIENHHKKIYILYCDTGVENPIVTNYVYHTFEKLSLENELHKLPFIFKILKPKIEDRFFVKVIGRGYPTPTNIFRWCTDKLRINPVSDFINKSGRSTILLGVRKSESEQRDRTISKHDSGNEYYLKQNNSKNKMIFSPIINHSLEEVWITLKSLELPKSIDYKKIREIYQDAESECGAIKTEKGKACGSSRFGCWTCTVVRQDKSVKNMILNGYNELNELYKFRNWIYEFRDNKNFRCRKRRNGIEGLGPFTIEARKIILNRLIKTETKSGFKLIEQEELTKIYELWDSDINNPKYFE
ncbi:phosphoadenosine phosphosulfate reductase family protein [Sphingobacterium sp.]|uniref:phosphoadenosine phosphosulfate reductase domain-containing protein n=1 Tax=Sphingobacterium sp. TaxID=341027 RepID=UPI0028B0B4E4|nr:phosphoadenosine phosphosulfate reductase family protein [Sphingobacterium sp.]